MLYPTILAALAMPNVRKRIKDRRAEIKKIVKLKIVIDSSREITIHQLLYMVPITNKVQFQ